MAVAIPIIAAIGGAGGAAAGATAIGTAISVGSALIGTVAAVKKGKFDKAVADQNAQIATENAEREVFQSQIDAQEQDVNARNEIGFFLNQAGAGGLSLTSGSLQGKRRSLEQLAAKDRGNIRNRGDVAASRSLQRAADFRTQGEAAQRESRFAAIGGAIEVGTSFISGAAKTSKLRARRIRGEV